MIRLYGWRGSGKTYSLAVRACELANQGKHVLVLEPSTYGVETFKERLKKLEGSKSNIEVKIFDDYFASDYDAILVDEIANCVNEFFEGKVDCITDSPNEDYMMKGLRGL